jgi:hypothetical protein
MLRDFSFHGSTSATAALLRLTEFSRQFGMQPMSKPGLCEL